MIYDPTPGAWEENKIDTEPKENDMSAMDIGIKLVALCSEGKFMDAIEQLYADDIVSVEASGGGGMEQTMTGIEAIKGKNKWWTDNNEVHSLDVQGPFAHADRFVVKFDLDLTPKSGPTAGQRTKMQEVGVYTVDGGKIAKEEFFHGNG